MTEQAISIPQRVLVVCRTDIGYLRGASSSFSSILLALNATKYGQEFQANNFAFSDLWRHLEELQAENVSEFQNSGAL